MSGLDDLAAKIRQLSAKKIKVGFFDTAYYIQGRNPVAYIATIQEFGSISKGNNIPPRPFMRPVLKNNTNTYAEITKHLLLDESKTPDDIAELIGARVMGDIQMSIASVYTPPLSKITLAMRYLREQNKAGFRGSKGLVERLRAQLESDNPPKLSSNTKPLNDSGLLLNSVNYRVD